MFIHGYVITTYKEELVTKIKTYKEELQIEERMRYFNSHY